MRAGGLSGASQDGTNPTDRAPGSPPLARPGAGAGERGPLSGRLGAQQDAQQRHTEQLAAPARRSVTARCLVKT